MLDANGAGPCHRRANGEQIIVIRGQFVFHLNFRHHQKVTLILQFFVRRLPGPKQFRAGLFKIHQVIGMVQQTHAIGFRIADTDLNFSCSAHKSPRIGLRTSDSLRDLPTT
jgi:hypothetical protein